MLETILCYTQLLIKTKYIDQYYISLNSQPTVQSHSGNSHSFGHVNCKLQVPFLMAVFFVFS